MELASPIFNLSWRQQFETRAGIVANLQANSLAPKLYENDNFAVQSLLEDLANDPDFQYAYIQPPEGEGILYEQGFAPDPSVDVISARSEIIFVAGISRVPQGQLVISLSRTSLDAANRILMLGGGAALALVLIVTTGVIYRSFQKITRPLTRMTTVMGQLTAGDLEVEVSDQERVDVIGKMAQAIQIFKNNALEIQTLERKQADSERQAKAEKERLLHELISDFENTIGNVVDGVASAATELQATSRQMADLSSRTNSQAIAVKEASEIAVHSVQSGAAATEELTVSASEINGQVTHSSDIASRAVEEAKSADQMINSLSESANSIGVVVSLINDISEQTNLLALNATIEAARAGDAGKGFAVVANEVKGLASQTNQATEKIAQQVREIQQVTTRAVSAIGEVSRTIENVESIASGISASIGEQNNATREISENVQRAAQSTSEVSTAIIQVSMAADQSGQASEDVLSASSELSVQSEKLRSEMTSFLNRIRAN